jgi:class 3 adenylate cyclase/tetratricopeptide (TPR) repeat protein
VEHKLATVMFVDLSESTALGERLDPERLMELMGAFGSAMRQEAESFGGIADPVGDAVVAAFGIPQAREDHATRALRAALAMQRHLAELNVTLADRLGVRLAMRIGVNSGRVLVPVGRRPDLRVVAGDTLNVAARLQQAAGPDQVVVSERTVRGAHGFGFADLGPVALRGRQKPVRAYLLVGADSATEPAPSFLRAPLVGRDRELGLLRARYEQAVVTGAPTLVAVSGSAGVGKSRLVEELKGTLAHAAPPPLVLEGRCVPDGETYEALGRILESHTGLLDGDPPAVAIGKIEQACSAGAGMATGAARTAAMLAYSVGIEEAGTPLASLSPRMVASEIRTAWRAFISGLARARPAVVILEDLHWASEAMLDLIQHLGEAVTGPVLFVWLARPELAERRPGWGSGEWGLVLNPLRPHESEALVGLLLDDADLAPRLRSRILARGEGNPFFLEEILRHLIDEGVIRRDGGCWRSVEGADDFEIPDTVQAVLAARLDRLTPTEKRAIQCAAVVGREFWLGSVAALGGRSPEEAADILARLADRDLIRARLGSAFAGEREFAFRHVLARDVALASLVGRDRAELHRRVAEWVEQIVGDRRREVVDLLAVHYLAAWEGAHRDPHRVPEEALQLRRRAFECLLLSSADARRRLALDVARRQATTALTLAQDHAETAEAQEQIAESYFAAYEGDGAWEHFRLAIEARREEGRPMARLAARALETPLRWPGTMRALPAQTEVAGLLEQGLDWAGPGDGEERARLLLLKSLWAHAYGRGDDVVVGPAECFAAGREAAAIAARLDRPDLESAALDGLGSAFIYEGRYGEAAVMTGRRRALAPRIDDPWEGGDVFAMSSWVDFHLGRYREAFAAADEGYARTIGVAPSVALHCLCWRGLARFRLGDWQGLFHDVGLARAILGERRDDPPHYASPILAAAALAHEIRGETEAADEHLGVLVAVEERAPASDRDAAPLARWASFTSLVLARRNRFDEALDLLERTTWRRGAREGVLAEARCEVVGAAGRWEEAATVVAGGRELVARTGLIALPAALDRLQGRAAAAAGRFAEATELLGRAVAAFDAIEARWDAASSRLDLAAVMAACGADPGAVAGPAAAELTRLGATTELDRASSLTSRVVAAAGRPSDPVGLG